MMTQFVYLGHTKLPCFAYAYFSFLWYKIDICIYFVYFNASYIPK